MIFSTTPTLEGHTIREYRGVVTGETIIGANVFKDFMAGIRDFFGGRSGTYEKVYAYGDVQRYGCGYLTLLGSI